MSDQSQLHRLHSLLEGWSLDVHEVRESLAYGNPERAERYRLKVVTAESEIRAVCRLIAASND